MSDYWRDVKGYEGRYVVSRDGVVRSVEHTITVNDHGRVYNKLIKERKLRPTIHSAGYYIVSLTKNGKSTLHFVHRLVAEAFIKNPNHLECINHKDENKKNNSVSNLEWCTTAYNNNYGTARMRAIEKLKGKSRKLSTDDIDFIRSHYKPRCKQFGTRGLGRMFGVSHHTIRYVLGGV